MWLSYFLYATEILFVKLEFTTLEVVLMINIFD